MSWVETYPELAKQCHVTKNMDLTPNNDSNGLRKKGWWKYDKVDDPDREFCGL